jgi:hypothetical protein
VHEAFALLFSVPFDAAALRSDEAPGLVLRAPPPARETSSPRLLRPLAIGAAAGAVAAGVATGLLAWHTAGLRDDVGGSGQDLGRVNEQIDSGNRWTLAAGITAGVLAATAVVLYVLDRRQR